MKLITQENVISTNKSDFIPITDGGYGPNKKKGKTLFSVNNYNIYN